MTALKCSLQLGFRYLQGVIGANQPLCIGSPVTFSAFVIPMRFSIDTVYWSFGDGTRNTSTGAMLVHNIDHVFSAPGIYPVEADIRGECFRAPAGLLLDMNNRQGTVSINAIFYNTLMGMCSSTPISFLGMVRTL